MNSMIQDLGLKLLTGINNILPLYLTYIVLKFFYKILNNISKLFLDRIGIEIPFLDIFIILLLVLSVGIVMINFIEKKYIRLAKKLLKGFSQ